MAGNRSSRPSAQRYSIRTFLPFDKALLLEAEMKRFNEMRIAICGLPNQHANHRRQRLLRARRERPHSGRTAEQRDELAASDHSITSSAMASRVAGTVRRS